MENANGSPVHLANRTIDSKRSLKVIIVGAGISGIISAIKLQEAISNLEIVIYDKNPGIGGTWFVNRYPGVACDIPAHVYQLSWESNTAWSEFYASGAEILQCWQRVVEKYDVEKYMKLSHNVTEARWHEVSAKWKVRVEDVQSGCAISDEGDVLITAIGILNLWDWPSIPGLMSFEGRLMHTASWDANFDAAGRNVAVIGAGSSGIQVVPSIQPKVKRLDHYVRGSTWIATPMAGQEVEKRVSGGSNFQYGPEEMKAWEDNPQSYLAYRKQVEEIVQSDYDVTLRGSANQTKARAYFQMLMAQRLSRRPELLEHFLPTFSPLCKRLTPGPGYLEALTEENVDVIVQPIELVTKTGILTKDGKQRDVDAIVCATGFNTHFNNRFPVYGVQERQLFDTEHDSKRPRLSTYLSMMVDGFPNMFMFLGPNQGLGTGNLLIILERVADYAVKAVQKLQSENILTLQPSKAATDGFTRFCDAQMKRTVFSEECQSWYKTDGRVSALWPGSSLHAIKALQNPRWEDFEYTFIDENELGWLGDGSTEADWKSEADKSYYLTSLQLIKDELPKGAVN